MNNILVQVVVLGYQDLFPVLNKDVNDCHNSLYYPQLFYDTEQKSILCYV